MSCWKCDKMSEKFCIPIRQINHCSIGTVNLFNKHCAELWFYPALLCSLLLFEKRFAGTFSAWLEYNSSFAQFECRILNFLVWGRLHFCNQRKPCGAILAIRIMHVPKTYRLRTSPPGRRRDVICSELDSCGIPVFKCDGSPGLASLSAALLLHVILTSANLLLK